MKSSKHYAISPDLLRELDAMRSRMSNRLSGSDVPPAGEDFYRFKGFCTAHDLVKNLAFGIGKAVISQTEEDILRHDQRTDEASNDRGNDEDEE